MKHLIAFALLLVTGFALADSGDKTPLYQVRAWNPVKHYGYAVGDTFNRTIEITVQKPYDLSIGSVPVAGSQQQGVELRNVDVKKVVAEDNVRYTLKLRYQIWTRADTAKGIDLPLAGLLVTGNNRQHPVKVPRFEFEISPLTARTGNDVEKVTDALRKPLEVESMFWQAGLGISLGALVIGFVGLTYLHADRAWFPGLGGPFAVSYRKLEQLPDTPSGMREGVMALHTAFRKTFGEAVMPHNVETLLAEHPSFSAIRSEAHDFFAMMNHYLFGVSGTREYQMMELRSFCRLCRDCERGVT